jgi:hypothetical protein
MKVWTRSLGDASIHVSALVVLGLLAFMYQDKPSGSAPSGRQKHPSSCRACASDPPAAKVEAFLVKAGCIDDPRYTE